ncbi:DUF4232 domain-containing protein [Streptomyces sp. NPDC002896]|uniref:DUF4232 domain-containing protein n=1 Tax=Streptomyces sp. NPDC002896 TaxID=3154438 RepID=UPI00332512F8
MGRRVTAIRAIRIRPVLFAVVTALTAIAASGCGLSAELDRERNPERRPEPSATSSVPPLPARSSGQVSSPSGPAQDETACPASGVRISAGPVDGAMGLRAQTVTLTNCGEQPYRLNGYPSVRVLDESGKVMSGVQTVQGTDSIPMAPPDDPEPGPLTLDPGESAQAGLVWRMGAGAGTYLRIAPTAGDDPVTVRMTDPLDIGPEQQLGTTAWHMAEG